jgi:hypothetical protein
MLQRAHETVGRQAGTIDVEQPDKWLPKDKMGDVPTIPFPTLATFLPISHRYHKGAFINIFILVLKTMHLPTLLPLITATAALGSSSPAPVNNTRIAVTSLVSALMGSADIDLDELGSEGLAKRKAMTYCANRQSTPGESLTLSCWSQHSCLCLS